MWDLALQKLLKAIFVSCNKTIPLIHDLNSLTRRIGLELREEEQNDLDEITTYYVEARYEEVKMALYKKATLKYTENWIKKCKKFYLLFSKKINL